MALFNLMQKLLPVPSLKEFYRDLFPIESRFYLAVWIENQPWEFMNPMEPSIAGIASSLLSKLVEEAESFSRRCTDKSLASMLCHQAHTINARYQSEPLNFLELMIKIIQKEKKHVLEQGKQLPPSIQEKQNDLEFITNLTEVRSNVRRVQTMRIELKQICEELKRTQDFTVLQSGHPNDTFLNKLEQESIPEKALQEGLHCLIQKVVQDVGALLSFVVRKIHLWKRQQQLSGNGAPFDDNLLSIQEWCESLVDIIFQMNQEILLVCSDAQIDPFPGLTEKLESMLHTVITSTFLVHKQPPQVLKTQARFDTGVRFLLGLKLLGMCQKLTTVKAMVITEMQARNLGTPGQVLNESTGEILNNISSLENNTSTKTCCATFKNPKLQKIKRSDRKGSESVTEEKFAVLFSTEITLSINNKKYQLQALSLPIVVIVHGSQDNNAAATILWDNAFSEVDRIPFVVPDRVPWHQMCETLNMKFMAEVQTSRRLIKEHFFFLAQKIFGESSTNLEDFENRCVSWSQFNKEVLPGRGFTFWQWFDGVLDLTKEFLKSYWSEGLIIGFISKTYVYHLLSSKTEGTFLLRFSDSEIGGITIAYIGKQTDDGPLQILNIQPFATKDLKIRSLGDRIRDIKLLQHLYPNQPKDVVFQKYYSKEQNRKDGYINSKIVTTVEGVAVQSPQPSEQQNPQICSLEMRQNPTILSMPFAPVRNPSPAVSPGVSPHIQDISTNLMQCPSYSLHTNVYRSSDQPIDSPIIMRQPPSMNPQVNYTISPTEAQVFSSPHRYPVQQPQLQAQVPVLHMDLTNELLDLGYPTDQEILNLIAQESPLPGPQHTDIVEDFLAMQE
ncbi:signal transducer and activator of transcription 6 isoform X2 [Protopterus annectens]|uniref:signal transducer and activator of transcription 6 isoform X2 n=1 Tax=Protopterus annectens TaxID=7888 RepID=UPI001CF9FC07|nr:signal transducer and activator of transcription 6 isoform X2 [Protopterus annectens]